MDKSPNKSFFKKSFSFQTSRWEEWHQGKCLSSGEINLKIEAIDQKDTILFIIAGELDQLRIERISTFSYAISTINEFPRYRGGEEDPEHTEMQGYISYNRELNLSSENDPTIVELHFENQTLARISFGFNSSNQDIRIIEFYRDRKQIDPPVQPTNEDNNGCSCWSGIGVLVILATIPAFFGHYSIAIYLSSLIYGILELISEIYLKLILTIFAIGLAIVILGYLVVRMRDVGKPWWHLLIPGFNIILCLWLLYTDKDLWNRLRKSDKKNNKSSNDREE